MKLRSIVLAGLLGAGLVMSSGCSEDAIEELVQGALKTAYIAVANGQTEPVFNVGSVGEVYVSQYETDFFVNTTQDSYTVSHGSIGDDPVSFPKGGGHLYGLCAAPHATTSANVVTDSNDGTRVKVVNLSVTDVASLDIKLTVDTTGNDIGDTNVSALVYANVCTKNAVPEFNAVDSRTVTALWIDGVEYAVPTYSPEVEDAIDKLAGAAEFDLIIFDVASKEGTIVPIIPPID